MLILFHQEEHQDTYYSHTLYFLLIPSEHAAVHAELLTPVQGY
jgi:hypothetical protein